MRYPFLNGSSSPQDSHADRKEGVGPQARQAKDEIRQRRAPQPLARSRPGPAPVLQDRRRIRYSVPDNRSQRPLVWVFVRPGPSAHGKECICDERGATSTSGTFEVLAQKYDRSYEEVDEGEATRDDLDEGEDT